MKKVLGIMMIVGGIAGGAAAQEGHPPMPSGGGFPQGGGQRMMQPPQFADIDKNKDKKLSKEEFAAFMPPQMAQMIPQIFDGMDENKDGSVDETEWANGQRRMMGGGGGRIPLGDAMMRYLDKNADSKVSAEEFGGLKALFANLDRDTSGSLSVEEMNPFFQSLMQRGGGPQGGPPGGGQREGRAQGQGGQGGPPGGGQGGGGQRFQMQSFAEMDKNGDKKLGRDEVPERMAQAFDMLDTNKDGGIDETEWSARMNRQGGPRFGETLVKFMDTNADSQVTPAEFARVETLFAGLDKDKNSELSVEELNQFNQVATQAASEVQNKATGGIDVNQLFVNLDKNKDGKITADEVASEKAFKSLDLNGDGTVTKEEATESLKKQAEKRQQKQSPPQQNQ